MSHNPEPKKCRATTKRTGEPCKNWAIKGGTVCKSHGGGSRKVRAKANRTLAQTQTRHKAMRALARFGQLPDTDTEPATHMLMLIAEKRMEVEWLGQYLENVDDKQLFMGITKLTTSSGPLGESTSETAEAGQHIAYQVLHKAQDQLAAYTSAAIKAGIEERQVQIAESTAAQFGQVLERIRTALGLTPQQAADWPAITSQAIKDTINATATQRP